MSSSSICRTCSLTKTKFVNLFNYYDNNNLVSEMLKECTSIEIQNDDGLPLHVCSECLDSLISAWHFRRMTIETDVKLHQLLCKQKQVNVYQDKDKAVTSAEAEPFTKDETCSLVSLESESVFITDINYNGVNQENATSFLENNKSNASKLVNSCIATSIDHGIHLYTQSYNAQQLQYIIENSRLDHNYALNYKDISNSSINAEKLSLLKCGTEKLADSSNTAVSRKNIQNVPSIEALLNVNVDNVQRKSTFSENQIVSVTTNSEQPLSISQSLVTSYEKRKPQSYFVVQAIKDAVQREPAEQLDAASKDDNGNSNKSNSKPNKLVILGEYRKLTREEKEKMSIRCRICKKIFKYSYYYQIHIRYHKGDLPYKCKTCDKSFARPSLLKSHAIIHSDTRPFACDTCRKTFKTANNLQIHKNTHLEERPYKCNICSLGFKSDSTMKTHRQRHEKERNCICETCGKTFVVRSDLRVHLRAHLDTKDFLCTECGKMFSTSSRLDKHYRHNHSNERPYACAHCDRRFKDKNVMKCHSLIHTGEKPHACKLCGKRFRQSVALRTHMRSHTGEAPYACKICPSQFKYSQLLTNHMRTHK